MQEHTPALPSVYLGANSSTAWGATSEACPVVSGRRLPSLGRHGCPDKATPNPWLETKASPSHQLPEGGCHVSHSKQSPRRHALQPCLVTTPSPCPACADVHRKDSTANGVSAGCVPPFSLTVNSSSFLSSLRGAKCADIASKEDRKQLAITREGQSSSSKPQI